MTRQEKYPDTGMFHFYNANPKNRFTTDCVIRAICTALQISYSKVVMEMAELQCKTGYDMSENKLIDKYLQSKGWKKHKQPRKESGKKYTGKEFCMYLKHYSDLSYYPNHIKGNVIANIGGHHTVCFFKEGNNYRCFDTWDSTDGSIGNYWVKE